MRSVKTNAMEEKVTLREVFESKCYYVRITSAMRIVGEEEACFDTKN